MADSTDVENQKKKKGQSDEHNSRERAFVPYRYRVLSLNFTKNAADVSEGLAKSAAGAPKQHLLKAQSGDNDETHASGGSGLFSQPRDTDGDVGSQLPFRPPAPPLGFEDILNISDLGQFKSEWRRYEGRIPRFKLDEINDAILCSIEHDELDNMKFLLEQLHYNMEHMDPNDQKPPKEELYRLRYSPTITPIILAYKLNKEKFVEILEKTRSPEIHHLSLKDCPFKEDYMCDECDLRFSYERNYDMEQSQQLVDIYDALASPHHLFAQPCNNQRKEQVDPIMEAFTISKELRKLQDTDPSFTKEYAEIELRCRQFATEMLGLCLRKAETDILFNHCNGGVKHPGIPKINEAVEYEQKEFVAHKYSQVRVREFWHKGVPKCGKWILKKNMVAFQLLCILLWMLVLPIACVIYCTGLCESVNLHMRYPMYKFTTKIISLICLLLLLILNQTLYGEHGMESNGNILGNFNVVEVLISVWILDYLIAHIMRTKKKFLYRYSPETVFLSCFCVWIILNAFAQLNSNIEIVADWFMAVGIIIAFLKVIPLLRVNNALAPLYLSLSQMFIDVVMIIFIFFIIITGFAVAITTVYGSSGVAIKEGEHTHYRVLQTYGALLWGVFGHGIIYEDSEKIDADTIDANTMDNGTNASTGAVLLFPAIELHFCSQLFVYLLIGIYLVLAVIVLINTLIAMMASTFNKIQENSDVEWKFASTKMLIDIGHDCGPLPVPFSTIGIVMDAVHAFVKRCRHSQQHSNKAGSYELQSTDNDRDTDPYQTLMEILKDRYWEKKGKDKKI